MARLREAQKQMTRRLLLDKGLEVFGEKGYAATTVDDIAAAAGTTRATFYLHFASKAELVRALVADTNDRLTAADEPSLTWVVESGDREQIGRWLARKFGQWAEIRPYVTVAHQAAAAEADIQSTVDQWYDTAIDDMERGLDAAGRFEPSSRRVRCSLAFGELEFLSRRWMRLGWTVDSDTALTMMTDSWCHLLAD